MALADYTTLPIMKLYVNVNSTSKYDGLLEDAITAASRDIDNRTGRYFGLEAASDRDFVASKSCTLFVDDISDISTATITDENDNAITDFQSFPINGVANGQPGWPVTRIKSDKFWPGCVYTVNAAWGWAEVPDVVEESCKLLAAETFLSKDTPHGVKGIDEFGVVRIRESRQIGMKLSPVTKYKVGFR